MSRIERVYFKCDYCKKEVDGIRPQTPIDTFGREYYPPADWMTIVAPTPKPCPTCGNLYPISAYPFQSAAQHFCSEACYLAHLEKERTP